MILYKEALLKIKEVALRRQTSWAPESRPLSQVVGKILAEDILSPESLPPFDNSAMDGFALSSSLSERASAENPVTLPVLGSLAAGDAPIEGSKERGVYEIMTGAPVPTTADCVVRIEDVKLIKDPNSKVTAIELKQSLSPKSHIRFAGSDFREGQVVLKKGTRLEPQHILALAGLGVAQVPVLRAVRLARISTGKELVSYDKKPQAGQIRNTTAPYFAALLPGLDIELVQEDAVGDEPGEFRQALTKALKNQVDVILTTGAVSMGKYDFVPEVIQELQAQTHFHKVAMQPGKPLLFASLANGTALFGLPGNPVSGMVGFRFFVENYLRVLRGQEMEKPLRLPVMKDAKKPPGLRQFAKAILHFDEKGQAQVEVLPGQMSYMLSPLMHSNAWAQLPEEKDFVSAGEWVDVYPLFSK